MGDENVTDHDLLIRLDTKFEFFVKNHTEMWGSFTDLVSKFMIAVEKKADKAIIDDMSLKIEDLKKKVDKHETQMEINNSKKQFVLSLGDWGAKGWGLLLTTIGTILAILAIYK